jgi:signal transduction histidine kinase/CheY-like chemotaxis protein
MSVRASPVRRHIITSPVASFRCRPSARVIVRSLLSLNLHHDQDVVTARQRAAQIARLLEFDTSEQTRLATAVSEIVRNAFRYAGGGVVHFDFDPDAHPQRLIVRVEDRGDGIADLDAVMSGRYQSSTGMGMGIAGARRLMDRFEIHSDREGTRVTLEKFVPPRASVVTARQADRIVDALGQRHPDGLIEEIQSQNQELLRALDELQRKQEDLTRLNRELEDTNRGVVALYAELDEKADHLRRADEMKSRFLSNMTHEFRTPVNAIIGLCNLLIEDRQQDGRPPEPELDYIHKAADQLSDLVNDLLDLAKVEAGKTVVRPADFEVSSLFGALRGMLKPVLLNRSVALVFDEVGKLPTLHTDEAKVSQILRNLLSNALKFTERGEVRVGAHVDAAGSRITFTVTDTGIGIEAHDQSRIFEEFAQLEHRLQRHVKGTGLGLPLSRRLAGLLGGSLTVESQPGAGSTFSLSIPVTYSAPATATAIFEWKADPARSPLLVVEDAPNDQFLYDKIFRLSQFQVYPAYTVREAEDALHKCSPVAIVMDLVLGGEEAWDFLIRLKRDEQTRQIPVVIVSAVARQEKAFALGADAYLVKPIERRTLIDTLTGLQARTRSAIRVLTIDDDPMSRYLLRQCLPAPTFDVSEAADGAGGLLRAASDQPDVILLDLVMPGKDGRETLADLRLNPLTSKIPVVICTGVELEPQDTRVLLEHASAILSKRNLSRSTAPAIVHQAVQRARPLTTRTEGSV